MSAPTTDRADEGAARLVGLTMVEAEARLRHGEGNTAVRGGSRTYVAILRANVFSFFNTVLFVIGVALLALGRYSDALISVGLGLFNAAISTAQEMRAKRKLDRLQLLDRNPVRVLRDGREAEVPPERVVRGDVVLLRVGEQIVVDGPLLDEGPLEADESLLTGESDPVVKRTGDLLLSGSHCVGGEGRQLAEAVGGASHASRLTTDARRATADTTPLQRTINGVVRLVIALTLLMSGTIVAQALLEGFSLLRTVQITAVLSGLVPYGLFSLIAVAYTTGAVRIAGRGALVQQVNAVESVSHVDVLCTDKTGTLTTGRLSLEAVEPLGDLDVEEVRAALGAYAGSVSVPNATTTALAAVLPRARWQLRDEVSFTSSLRWSGVVTDQGSWLLGAPEALVETVDARLADLVSGWTAAGLRVLVFGRAADAGRLHDGDGQPVRPPVQVVAAVALADELRPDAAEAIAAFRADGVAIKVISGDDPRTVAALARRAGLEVARPASGAALDELDEARFDKLVGATSVFGRVRPEQKERIVASLRRQGRYVAMIGDGVNDARALKAAQVGVAMRSGSAVTRDVADIVLTEDSFAALRPAQAEGRTIVNGLAASMYVFLARVATQGLIIVAVTMLGLGFPYSPTQVGLTLFTVGVPTLFLTFWARPDPPDTRLLRHLVRFVMPAAVITAAFGTAIYATLYTLVLKGFVTGRTPASVIAEFESYTGLAYADSGFTEAAATIAAQTGLNTFVSLVSVLLILFIAPPHRVFASWCPTVADKRPLLLVVALLLVLVAVLFVPALYSYFGLTAVAGPVYDIVLPAVGLWFVVLSLAYRCRLYDRILGRPLEA